MLWVCGEPVSARLSMRIEQELRGPALMEECEESRLPDLSLHPLASHLGIPSGPAETQFISRGSHKEVTPFSVGKPLSTRIQRPRLGSVFSSLPVVPTPYQPNHLA